MYREKSKTISTIDIYVYGIVQGVGFRPFIATLADKYNIKGEVRNEGGYVKIKATGAIEPLECFIKGISIDKPKASEIIHIEVKDAKIKNFKDFSIIESTESNKDIVMLPADLPICEDCLKEMYASSDRRSRHQFISCIACGPRYSIIDKVPYDRCNTAMVDFSMCSNCENEYTNRKHRRYHAQTISCHQCGPYLIYRDSNNVEVTEEDALKTAIEAIKEGKIIAIKGVGGYHLSCNPFDTKVIERLRVLKQRDKKPFALMFSNIETIEKYCYISEKEIELLKSNATPIVLLKRKESNISQSIYNHSKFLGVFLPYTPLQHLILDYCNPVVMTSANLSNLPIIKDEEELFNFMNNGLDGVLYNKREIRVRLDDSVAKIIAEETQIARRSRGYVPLPIYVEGGSTNFNGKVFATGAQLKASFCITKGNFLYQSEYLGDLDDDKYCDVYKESYYHMKNIFGIDPEIVVCDVHPGYFTTNFAEQLNIPLIKAQHHHAHIASVMAEHNVQSVIGVAFDGTGYGSDGAIWGSEFLVCTGDSFVRKGHLKYINILGGDESMKDAAKTGICYLISENCEKNIKDARKDVILSAIRNQINTFKCSSMGRLFDAVSCLLNICDYNDFEGECAIKLEGMAMEALDMGLDPLIISFETYEENNEIIADYGKLIRGISEAEKNDENIRRLALGFHYSVANMVIDIVNRISKHHGIFNVALSGGVFQNSILLRRCKQILMENGFKVYINNKVPPNDGGISLGQAYIGMEYLKRRGI